MLALMGHMSGERGRNRTYNLLIKSQLLCQLSYAPDLGSTRGCRRYAIFARANFSIVSLAGLLRAGLLRAGLLRK
jgi:hypothetical protein